MKDVSRGQLSEMLGRFSTQVRWGEIDGALLQQRVISLSAEEFGNRFTAFLSNGARMSSPSSILRSCNLFIFDPSQFPGLEGWDIWKGPVGGDGLAGEPEVDKRSLELSEVDFSKVLFETMLKPGETTIKGEERFRRLKETSHILLGGNIFLALWVDYQQHGESSVLEWLRTNCNITWFDLPGLTLRSPDGRRCALDFYWCGDRWHWRCLWLAADWRDDDPSGALASSPLASVP